MISKVLSTRLVKVDVIPQLLFERVDKIKDTTAQLILSSKLLFYHTK